MMVFGNAEPDEPYEPSRPDNVVELVMAVTAAPLLMQLNAAEAQRDDLREALTELLSYIDCGKKTPGAYGDYTNVTFSPNTVEIVRAHRALRASL